VGFSNVTDFDFAAMRRRIAVRIDVFTGKTAGGTTRGRAVKKIMHRTALRRCWRLWRSAKRANQCRAIRGRSSAACLFRHSAEPLRAKFSISIPV
jgi:hypothetical protein